MEAYDLAEAAQRSGLSAGELGRLVELSILTPDAPRIGPAERGGPGVT